MYMYVCTYICVYVCMCVCVCSFFSTWEHLIFPETFVEETILSLMNDVSALVENQLAIDL